MIESIEAALFPIVCKINEYLSNYILVFLLLGIGFWYSSRPASSRSAASRRAGTACSATCRCAARSMTAV